MPVIRRRSCRNRACGATIHPDDTCPRCGTAHGKSLNRQRQRTTGRDTAHWKQLRAQAIAAHPYCQQCGSREALTVHHKRYPARTLDDIGAVWCASCHGRFSQLKGERGY